MGQNKKSRAGRKYKEREVAHNPIDLVFGGMHRITGLNLTELSTRNHAALNCLANGHGTRELWNQLCGAINVGNIMCERGMGDEYRAEMLAGRDALVMIGTRHLETEAFDFLDGEAAAIELALDVHDAQLENSRVVDKERAADEVVRRIRLGINAVAVKDGRHGRRPAPRPTAQEAA